VHTEDARADGGLKGRPPQQPRVAARLCKAAAAAPVMGFAAGVRAFIRMNVLLAALGWGTFQPAHVGHFSTGIAPSPERQRARPRIRDDRPSSPGHLARSGRQRTDPLA